MTAAAATNPLRRHRFSLVGTSAPGADPDRLTLSPAFTADLERHSAPMGREESIAAGRALRAARVACWRAILSHATHGARVLPSWLSGDLAGRADYDAACAAVRACKRPTPNRAARRAHAATCDTLAASVLAADQCPDVLPRDRDDLGLVRAREEVARLASRLPDLRPWHAAVEHAFAARARALHLMQVRNLRLVVAIARRYVAHHGAESLTLADLTGYGEPGLYLACLRFDPEKGYAFSTYAIGWIRHTIGRAIADHGRLIRITSHGCDRIAKITAARRKLAAEGKSTEAEAVAKVTGLSVAKVRQADRDLVTVHTTSMEAPIYFDHDSGDVVTLRELRPDDDASSPDEVMAERERAEILLDLMSTLSPRERLVVAARFGLDDGHERTTADLGRAMSVTRERARQIEKEALAKMRARAIDRGLADASVLGKAPPVSRGRVSILVSAQASAAQTSLPIG